MPNRNVEGFAHRLLTDALKHVCEFCNSSLFYIVNTDSDENTNLPADTKAYLWENSTPTAPYANMETLKIMCASCGKISGKLIWCLDVVSAMATPAVTATHISAAVANGLTGLYLTPLGGTSVGISFPIASNTLADPTVITVTGAINDDSNGEIILLSSWQVF